MAQHAVDCRPGLLKGPCCRVRQTIQNEMLRYALSMTFKHMEKMFSNTTSISKRWHHIWIVPLKNDLLETIVKE